MAWLDFLPRRPLASGEEKSERLGTLSGVPIFGLDALGSAAYGPEAALTLLIPLGVGEIHYIVPITIVIIALLGIVYFWSPSTDSNMCSFACYEILLVVSLIAVLVIGAS